MAIDRRFLEETKDAILQHMLNNLSSDVDKRQGSVSWDLLSPAAIELEKMYIALDNILQFGFVNENQPGEYLDLRCAEQGLTRKPTEKATGTVTFYGDDGTLIPLGTEIYTDEEIPIYFVTTEEGAITNGSLTVATEAKEGGVKGNVAIGKITLVTGNITGVASVTNEVDFEGGVDEETDVSLMNRYFERVQYPATSGNASHYRQWALEVAGISDCKIYPVWNGNGTVKVVLLSDDKKAPSQTIVDNVIAHIENVRPIGATVTIAGATEIPINVSATLVLAEGKTLADAQTEIETGIIEYLKTLAFNDPIVRYTRIANVILDAHSVLDYSNLTVNSNTENIQINDGSVAVLGTVSLTE